MGKGYNNYMCKKFFHPSSKENQKRLWQAQKKNEGDLQAQAELRAQYDKEQELYQNKALLNKESKDKMEMNFMYEPPPGCKKPGEDNGGDNEDNEPRFEWQRTWGTAPKESYLGEGDNFAEQPFGIQVCQAKCMKCGAFGHQNIDKRCPLYGKAVDSDAPMVSRDSAKLISEMKQEGMAMRWNDMGMETGKSVQMGGKSIEMVDAVERPRGTVDRKEVLRNMTKEDKKKLLKQLMKADKKKKKKSKRNDTSDDDSDDEKKVRVKREPESRRGVKREPESRREVKREPESRREERKKRHDTSDESEDEVRVKREPESRREVREPESRREVREPESRREAKREPESRRKKRHDTSDEESEEEVRVKREPESRREVREPESRRRSRSRSRGERRERSRSRGERRERSRSRGERRRSRSRSEKRKERRSRSRSERRRSRSRSEKRSSRRS